GVFLFRTYYHERFLIELVVRYYTLPSKLKWVSRVIVAFTSLQIVEKPTYFICSIHILILFPSGYTVLISTLLEHHSSTSIPASFKALHAASILVSSSASNVCK